MHIKQQVAIDTTKVKVIENSKRCLHGHKGMMRVPHGTHSRKEYIEECDCVACNVMFGRDAQFRFAKPEKTDAEILATKRAKIEEEVYRMLDEIKRKKEVYLWKGKRVEIHTSFTRALLMQAKALAAQIA